MAEPALAGVSTDPVTLQIVANALQSIADEMATTIFRTAHSTVVRDGMDFSAALCGPDGETVAQAVTVPFHLGSVPHALDTLSAKWADRMQPGDVFVMNDPFDGGIHLQDIFVFRPVYLDGTLIDSGPIILQQAIDLPEAVDAAEVREALRPIEHDLFSSYRVTLPLVRSPQLTVLTLTPPHRFRLLSNLRPAHL